MTVITNAVDVVVDETGAASLHSAGGFGGRDGVRFVVCPGLER